MDTQIKNVARHQLCQHGTKWLERKQTAFVRAWQLGVASVSFTPPSHPLQPPSAPPYRHFHHGSPSVSSSPQPLPACPTLAAAFCSSFTPALVWLTLWHGAWTGMPRAENEHTLKARKSASNGTWTWAWRRMQGVPCSCMAQHGTPSCRHGDSLQHIARLPPTHAC